MTTGTKISIGPDGALNVPDQPIITFIQGDGVGPDLWRAAQPVFDAAVKRSSGGARSVAWMEVLAGEVAHEKTGEYLSQETLDTLREYHVGIKGPLTTPVGGGIRSLNVTIRHKLDLFACIRPVKYIPGVPAPVRDPQKVDMIVFRENNEDVYAGLEWPSGSEEVKKARGFFQKELGVTLREDTALGLKPMSPYGSKRLVRKAVQWALDRGSKSVTLVHKGNIMKFTEGGFRDWGYELARQEFGDRTVTEAELAGGDPGGRVVGQGPHCRRHVPAGPAAAGRIRRPGPAQSERRLHLRRPGRSGRRTGHGARSQYRR